MSDEPEQRVQANIHKRAPIVLIRQVLPPHPLDGLDVLTLEGLEDVPPFALTAAAARRLVRRLRQGLKRMKERQ